MLLDELMPRYDVAAQYETLVDASIFREWIAKLPPHELAKHACGAANRPDRSNADMKG